MNPLPKLKQMASRGQDEQSKPFVHANAIVGSGARIGKGTRVWAFVNICPGAEIGDECNICDRVFIENRVRIGNRVTIKCGVSVWDGVTLEDDVFVGPGVAFTNDLRPRSKVYLDVVPTRICRGASIGANATILPGLTIGAYAMIGAGAVVTESVPDFALMMGNPAKFRGWVCRCAKRLRFGDTYAKCECGRAYRIVAGRVEETTVN